MAALVALMAILVLGALIFLVASRSSEPSSGAGAEPTPTPKSSPTPESTPHPGLSEPETLEDLVLVQVGPFKLDAWGWETADATAAGAIDGVGMSYLHIDNGTALVVSIC